MTVIQTAQNGKYACLEQRGVTYLRGSFRPGPPAHRKVPQSPLCTQSPLCCLSYIQSTPGCTRLTPGCSQSPGCNRWTPGCSQSPGCRLSWIQSAGWSLILLHQDPQLISPCQQGQSCPALGLTVSPVLGCSQSPGSAHSQSPDPGCSQNPDPGCSQSLCRSFDLLILLCSQSHALCLTHPRLVCLQSKTMTG